MESPRVKKLAEVVGDQFASTIQEAIPGFAGVEKGFVPNVTVIIGEDRGARRDAALALLQEYRGDIFRDRTVVISDYPQEIPAQPPKENATMLEYTYAPALFSVSPESTQLPDEKVMDEILGAMPMMTRLERTMKDFTRWDIDFYVVLSPLDLHAWQTLASLSLLGMLMFAGTERRNGEPIKIGESAIQAFNTIGASSPEGHAAFIDLDQKRVFRTLADAQITA